MDLFTYLLAKNDKVSVVHKGDLFSYLLGRNAKGELKTATGYNIHITDVTKVKINELLMSKLSSQDGEPSPENPVEIKTVKGYRNEFDEALLSQQANYNTYNENTKLWTTTSVNGYSQSILYGANGVASSRDITKLIKLGIGTYTIKFYDFVNNTDYSPNSIQFGLFDSTGTLISNSGGDAITTIVTTQECYLDIRRRSSAGTFSFSKIMIIEGTEEKPYVPYGNNYVYTKVTNGTDTNYFTIPLNGNEIAGIGNYKDELIVDSDGHCWLNKLTNKVVLDGSENWNYQSANNRFYLIYEANQIIGIGLSNKLIFDANLSLNDTFSLSARYLYIKHEEITTATAFKEWLQLQYNNNNPIYIMYALQTPDIIDLNYDVDIRLFKGVNNISNSDDMDMALKYY